MTGSIIHLFEDLSLGGIECVVHVSFYEAAGFPSFHEGFGLPVLKAMACGTPVLCSTAPALLELTGDAAAHADPGDHRAWEAALRRLLEDPGQRKALATRGRARASQFSPERTAAGILQVLQEVVGWRR